MSLQSILSDWKQKVVVAAQEPLAASIPAFVDAEVSRRPDQVLLDFFETGEQVSYRELGDGSRKIAGAMGAMGLRPGMCIAVMLANGPQWHMTWLAALRLGVKVLPVNPTYTARELEYVLSDSQARAWFLPYDRAGVADSLSTWPARLRRDWVIPVGEGLAGNSPWHRMLAADPLTLRSGMEESVTLDTVANIQYTSGTTGFPKGCVLTHGYWLNLAQQACLIHVGEMKRFFTAQPFYYMDPFWQLLMTIRRGGTLTVARKISSTRFLGWLVDQAIEWAQLPEIALKSMDSVDSRDLKLQQVFTFGWGAESRRRFVERFKLPATESFGMTETGLVLAMPPLWPATDKAVSVGVPHLRSEARIVDEGGKEVGAEVTGELQIRGRYLFKGYFNKPEANADAFDGEWFRTGDAFIRDADGFYRIVGRFKDMIRRSGENIAAREVEAVVRLLPEVLDCAAVPVMDEARGEEVKIVVQLHPHLLSGGRPATDVLTPSAIIEHCKGELAPFKVPRYIQFIEEFPRTSSNKIAKHVLGASAADPRAGAYDRAEGRWVPEA